MIANLATPAPRSSALRPARGCSRCHAAPLDPIPLWPGGAPGALGTGEDDIPTLTAFLPAPDKATGAAIVICPGGGYGGLAPHEGAGYAEWLAENGIAGIVLKYRLGSKGYRHPAMLNDAARAVRLTRSKAAEWKIDAKRVGIMGSSAGGHLASTLLTHFDAGKADATPIPSSASARGPTSASSATRSSPWARTPTAARRKTSSAKIPRPNWSNCSPTKSRSPRTRRPRFIWHTWEDKAREGRKLPRFRRRPAQSAGVPFDLHVYQKGGHGMGLGGGRAGGVLHPWAADCLFWLKAQGFAK